VDGIADFVTRAEAGAVLPMLGVVKATARDTNGAFELLEYHGPIQPPPHIHREHDEAFYILAGSFTFILGTDECAAARGDLVWVPRGTRHGFRAASDARALLLTIPAGLEGFFRELSAGIAVGKTSDEIRAALAGRYDSVPAP
jgi:mannose-6-phosphate isomerase-like protein (cupin superfamily)